MVAPAGNTNYGSVQSVVNKLKDENKQGYNLLMTYVLYPYLANLDYDIYDLDTAEIDFEHGNIHIKVNKDITVTFTLDEDVEGALTNDADKILLFFDYNTSKFVLKFKVLGEWSVVEETVFVNPADSSNLVPEEEKKKFIKISTYLKRTEVVKGHKDKGNRFFTEAVVDGLLDKGEWNNDFVRHSLANELKNPSEDMVKLLASRLVKDYTTQNEEKVAEQLAPIIEEGLSSVVDYIVSSGYLPISNPQYPSQKPVVKSEPKQPSQIDEKPKTKPADKGNIENSLKGLGFEVGKPSDKSSDESKEDNKPQEKKPQERKTSLEDLVANKNKEEYEHKISDDGSVSLDGML